MVAGIAHEINNSIGFLKGSLRNAEEYIQELLSHVDCYQHCYPEPLPVVQQHAEEIDLDFLARDLPKMLSSMKGAIERIRNISTSLRTFSRSDTDQRVACDIHLFTTKGVGKGTGLGLSIARQIVEETHGGHLSCYSKLNQGTEFVIEIPIASAQLS